MGSRSQDTTSPGEWAQHTKHDDARCSGPGLRGVVLVVAACSLFGLTPTALAQRDAKPTRADQPTRTDQPTRAQTPRDRLTDLRSELQRQVQSLIERQRLLERAIKQLDEGADPAQVQARLRQANGEHPRGMGNGGQDGGRNGGRGAQQNPSMRGGDGFRGPPQGDAPRGMRSRPMRDLTEEDKANIIAFIKKQSPTLWKQIGDEPASVDRMVRRIGPRYFAYVDASKRDKRLGELTLKDFEAGFQVMRAIGDLYRINAEPTPDEERVRERIGTVRRAIAQQFDVKLQIQRRELALLKKRVQKLEDEVDTTETNRSRTLAEHLERVVGDVKRRAQNARDRHRGNPTRERQLNDRKPGERPGKDAAPTRRRGG